MEIGKEIISGEFGFWDILLVLNIVFFVYVIIDGGVVGDVCVNVCGFSQCNVFIFINGVLMNDIENGWLYWFNWDGFGDVISMIQMQCGLSNVMFFMLFIGGIMNIIIDLVGIKCGGLVKFEVGSDEFYKIIGVYNIGLFVGKFVVIVVGVVKMGDGNLCGVWSEVFGYYVGVIWKINLMYCLEVFVVGLLQEYGQCCFVFNIVVYDVVYVCKLGYIDV